MKENTTSCIVKHAHDMVLFFEAVNSNPNGDPDAGNTPRMKPGTNIGQVSSGCMKRKTRTTAQALYGGEDVRYAKLFFDTDQSLHAKEDAVADRLFGITAKKLGDTKAKHPEMAVQFDKAICEEYADVRLYGAALMQSGEKIQGPVQFSTAESVSPIEVIHKQLTRRAIADDKGLLDEGKETMFGEKHIVPYGLYRAYIYVTPKFAEKSGMTEQDLERLRQSIIHMFDEDKSAARPDMRVRALYDFEHLDGDNTLRYRTVESLSVTPVDEVANGTRMAEGFSDFTITVDEEALPDTIRVHKLL